MKKIGNRKMWKNRLLAISFFFFIITIKREEFYLTV